MAKVNGDLAFIHVPKNAGKAVGRAFLKDHKYDGDHSRAAYKYIKLKKFMVCRNPYDRMISAYEYQKKMADLDIGISAFAQRKFIKKSKPTFSQFVNFIHSFKKVNELHTRPQIYWLKYTNGLPISDLKIIRFENLKQELDDYFMQLGRPLINLESVNCSKRSNFLDYYSNPVTISQVKDLYLADFKIFKYSVKFADFKL